MELVSQFTEDAIAKEDHDCERLACHWRIFKNEPCHYVANMIPGQPGWLVCGTCYLGYRQKISSLVRPSGKCRNYIDRLQCLSWLSHCSLAYTYPEHAKTSQHAKSSTSGSFNHMPKCE
jgi:hypothetical protein